MLASVDIVLPCLDEAAALPWVLERLPPGSRAIVADNGSTDGSAELAEKLGATVVHCPDRGYGAACHAGLEVASAPYVAFCDCDGSLDPRDVGRLVEALEDGHDLAVCRRRPVSAQAWSRTGRLANKELARRVRRRTSLRIADVGPFRVARRAPFLQLGVSDRRFGYPVETLVRAADAGWRVAQVDVDYLPRIGTSKVSGTLRGSFRAFRDMSAVLSA